MHNCSCSQQLQGWEHRLAPLRHERYSEWRTALARSHVGLCHRRLSCVDTVLVLWAACCYSYRYALP
jgi:hypothetical protein